MCSLPVGLVVFTYEILVHRYATLENSPFQRKVRIFLHARALRMSLQTRLGYSIDATEYLAIVL